MSRKRRIFDIDMPVGSTETDEPRITSLDAGAARRGPMASAIAENAGALTARAEAESKIRAENDALAHEYVALKRAGLVVRMVPLDAIVSEALTRDRKAGPDPELDELVTSIREVGLSNPIRVEEREDGCFELIQGWRRLSAYRQLQGELGDEWAEIPAGILPRGEGIAGLYRRMVDENLIRRDLSFAEMAEAARAYAADPEVEAVDIDVAVRDLFRSAGYQKRSYIRSFARLLDILAGAVKNPEAIPRNLGLDLLRQLETQPDTVSALCAQLAALEDATAEDEVATIRAFILPKTRVAEGEKTPSKGQGGRRPRTTFEVAHGEERVKCTAGIGQLVLKMDRDMTVVDRQKLEKGIARLLDSLK